MYDVAIVGAGPAGATLARLIGSHYRVLLLDKHSPSDPDRGREKCCGGLLAPDAQEMMAKLGLGLPHEVVMGPQLFAVRTIDIDSGQERFYQRHYINMNRVKFEAWLLTMLDDHVALREDCSVKSVFSQNGSVELTIHSQGKEFKENAKVVVGADGANSIVRKACSYHPQTDKYTSLQEWYTTKNPQPYFGGIFDSEITDFYSWTIPKEDMIILGTAVPFGVDPNEKFALLKRRAIAHGFEFGEKLRRHGCFLLRPTSISQIYLGERHFALIGEAAGFISPSSAEGISYAFRSAQMLADVLNDSLGDWLPRYRRAARPLFSNIRLKNLKSRVICNPFLRKLVMRSGIGAMKRQ